MSKFVTSDLHFGHDRKFIYEPRGFSSIEEHDEAIVTNWNKIVKSPYDEVYVLGDLMLGDIKHGIEYLSRLNGQIHIVCGNHDTDNRIVNYMELFNVIYLGYASQINYKGYHFYLSHFPTITGNLEQESLKKMTLNLFGHTHSKERFYNDIPFMYNVALDANDCIPIELDTVIQRMEDKVEECKKFL